MVKILGFVAGAAFLLSACNSNSEKTASSTTDTGTTTTPVTSPAVNPSPIVAPNTASTAASGVNPAHGEPGHRCDIPVGAALNTPPAGPNVNPTVTTTPTVTTAPSIVQPVATPKATAPGMNPEHGQPGHRCDIPVGSPLNSKPAANSPMMVTPAKTN